MTLGEYLRLVLAGDAGVAGAAATRIYTEVLPQGTLAGPSVVFTVFGGDDDLALEGRTGPWLRNVQIDSWAATRKASSALAALVLAALAPHTGGAQGFELEAFILTNERWDFDAETELYRTVQDYEVHGN